MEQDIVQLQRLSQDEVHLSLLNVLDVPWVHPAVWMSPVAKGSEPLATFPLLFSGCDSCYFMESLVNGSAKMSQ